MLDGIHADTAAELCLAGDLAWMLDEHQERLIYNPYREWETRFKQDGGASRIFMIDAGRQVGKTFTTDLIRIEDCLRNPGSKYLLASAEEISLKEFIIPNIDAINEQLPPEVRAEFVAHRYGMKAAYYFPNDSILKLVGIDKNPKGLRGPKLHGASVHEAAFVTKLKHVIGSVLYPQFQREDAATLVLESSAPEDAEHAFDTVFRESCIKRKAYVFLTIRENTALSTRKQDEFIEAAREIDPDDADREYFGKRIRKADKTVFREYDVERHTRAGVQVPQYAQTMTWLDPGQRHFFAIVFSHYDAARDVVVAADAWAEKNPNSERVAAITAAREYDLWGVHPAAKLSRIPLDDIYGRNGKLKQIGWRTLLQGDRCLKHAEKLFELAAAEDEDAESPPSALRWYNNDVKRWENNPVLRVSDTSLQTINDLTTLYGLSVAPTTKDDLKAMTQLVRQRLNRGKFEVDVTHIGGQLLSRHLWACTWNDQHTKFAEHEDYGHFDLAAATVYGLRAWQAYYHYLPDPPEHLGKMGDDWVGDISDDFGDDDDDFDF